MKGFVGSHIIALSIGDRDYSSISWYLHQFPRFASLETVRGEVTIVKSKKKKTKKLATRSKANTRKLSKSSTIKITYKNEWLLFVGGTETMRREAAGKAQYENLLEIKKKHEVSFKEKLISQHLKPFIARYKNLLKKTDKADKEQHKRLLKEMDEVVIKRMEERNWQEMILLRTSDKPATIDLLGYDNDMLKVRLLGNIDDVDISVNPFLWLKKTKGRLLDLYGLSGLVLHNLSLKHIKTLRLIRTILMKIKVSTENTTTPCGMFVITMEDKKNLKKLPEGFTDLFKIVDLKKKKNVKGNCK